MIVLNVVLALHDGKVDDKNEEDPTKDFVDEDDELFSVPGVELGSVQLLGTNIKAKAKAASNASDRSITDGRYIIVLILFCFLFCFCSTCFLTPFERALYLIGSYCCYSSITQTFR
mmetsp:Transcript_9856/g.14695  ORF Transcript_9856/g.14695 Transcript_9856/m.14695 type:complete len:116 (-) Transcript_9856:84-431(-)